MRKRQSVIRLRSAIIRFAVDEVEIDFVQTPTEPTIVAFHFVCTLVVVMLCLIIFNFKALYPETTRYTTCKNEIKLCLQKIRMETLIIIRF